MNVTLEQRVSAFIHDSVEEMRSAASALGLKLRHLVAGRPGETRAAKQVSPAGPSPRSERQDIRELRGFGGIRPDYDHKAMRTEDSRQS